MLNDGESLFHLYFDILFSQMQFELKNVLETAMKKITHKKIHSKK